MKCFESQECKNIGMVAPFAGAWIEITVIKVAQFADGVAPFAGAWIEISQSVITMCAPTSLPSRERGLKWNI